MSELSSPPITLAVLVPANHAQDIMALYGLHQFFRAVCRNLINGKINFSKLKCNIKDRFKVRHTSLINVSMTTN
jgi:hypothetical protein